MLQPQDYQYDLFISYAREDASWVEGRLRPGLGLANDRIITEAMFRPGAAVVTEYERAVTQSRYTLLVLTPAFLVDKWTALSENLVSFLSAQQQADRLIPLQLRECELPLRIDFRVRLDCTDEANWQNEIARLRALLSAPEPEVPDIPCPYPGMVPFRPEDARFFHGREAEIGWIVNHLRHQSFLLVVGPSGSGKSSLITAGVLPHLADSSYFKNRPWLIRQMRPGQDPWQALSDTLCADPTRPAEAVAGLLAAHAPAARLLLVIDPFEALFTQAAAAEQKRFIATLKELRALDNCAAIVTLRSDFYDDLMRSDLSPIDPSQYKEVLPLKGEALRQAIERPAMAADGGVYLETRLVDALLADAAEERGALPMLQETLVQLWERRQFRFLPYQPYEELKVDGRSGLAVAMTVKADATLARLSQSQQDIARRIFLRLVQFGEGRVDTRRQQPVSALRSVGEDPAEFERTLYYLADNRLLTLDAGPAGSVTEQVDIAHETLFVGWPRLAGWMKEHREAEQMRRRLEDKAKEWDRRGRTGGLLDAIELGEARRWLDSPDAPLVGHIEVVDQLIQASQQAQDALEQEKRAIHEREIEDARRLEAERQRRMKVVIALIGVLAVGILTTVLILWRLSVAQAAAAISERQNESLQWTEKAQENLVPDPVVSLAYAAKALPQGPGDPRPYLPLPEFVLRQAFRRSLERGYAAFPGRLFAATQVDPNGPAIAIAGNSLHLVAHDLAATSTVTLTGHTEPVQGVQWTPNGELLSSDTQTLRVWQDNRQVAVQDFGPDGIHAVALRPGHPEVAVCTGTGLRLWAYRGAELKRLDGSTGCDGTDVSSPLRWSPDGNWLAVWDQNGTLALWDVETGQRTSLAQLEEGQHYLEAAWAPDGKHLAEIADDLKLRIWNSPAQNPTPRTIHAAAADQAGVIAGLLFIDNEHFVVWGWENKAGLWSVDGGHLRSFDPQAGAMRGVELSPDRKELLTFMSGEFYQWDLETGKPTAFYGHRNPVLDADWRGKYVVTGGADGTARIWDAETGQELITLYASAAAGLGQRSDVLRVRWQPDGRLLTAGSDGTLRLWQIFDNRGEPMCAGSDVAGQPRCFADGLEMAGPDVTLKSAAWMDEDTMVANEANGRIWRWNLATDRLESLPAAPNSGRRSVVWSPDGGRAFIYPGLASAGEGQPGGEVWALDALTMTTPIAGPIAKAFWLDAGLLIAPKEGNVRLVDPKTGVTITELPGQWPDITDAQAQGSRLAIASVDAAVRIWDAKTGKLLAEPGKEQPSLVTHLRWTADGKGLLTAGTSLQLWDAESGKLIRKFEASDGFVGPPVFSPGDQRYVAAGVGSTLYVWDRQTGKVLWSVKEPGTTIRGVQWTTGARWDGKGPRLLLLAWSGETAHLWDWNENKFEVMRVLGSEPVETAAVSSDGEWIATVEGGKVRGWHAWLNQPQSLLEAARQNITRSVAPATVGP